MTDKPKTNLENLDPNVRFNLLALIQPGTARVEDILPKFEIMAEVMLRDTRPVSLLAKGDSGTGKEAKLH